MLASRWFRPVVLAALLAAATPAVAEDYWDNNDWDIADAQADLAQAVGDLPVHEIRVDRYGISVIAGDPEASQGLHSINWREGVVTDHFDTMAAMMLRMNDAEPFAFSEVSITELPAVKAAAIEAFAAPDARIDGIVATKPTDRASKKRVVLWTIDLKQANREEGEVLVTALGQVVNVKLPESRLAAAAPWIAPASVAALFVRLEDQFGPEARFAEITVNDEWAIVQVEDRQTPGQLAEFRVGPQEITRSLSNMPAGMPMAASLERPFTLAEIAPLDAAMLQTLAGRTLDRMGGDGFTVSRYTISRSILFMTPEDDRLLLEIRADMADGWTGGRVTYDMAGEAVDVVTP